jgi:hypothetical protein
MRVQRAINPKTGASRGLSGTPKNPVGRSSGVTSGRRSLAWGIHTAGILKTLLPTGSPLTWWPGETAGMDRDAPGKAFQQ